MTSSLCLRVFPAACSLRLGAALSTSPPSELRCPMNARKVFRLVLITAATVFLPGCLVFTC
jgi:hypothetical protein